MPRTHHFWKCLKKANDLNERPCDISKADQFGDKMLHDDGLLR